MKPNNRSKPFSIKRDQQQGGQSGALTALFKRFPEVEELLTKAILEKATKGKAKTFRLRQTDLHNFFIRCVKKVGVPEKEWPFNTSYQGRRTIARYMKEVMHDNFADSVRLRQDSAASVRLNTGSGESPFISFPDPFDGVELDAYYEDAHFTVVFSTPEGVETDKVILRLWLISLIDIASSAVLAYKVVYRSEVAAEDVVAVIRDAVTKSWQPMGLTVPSLTYPSGGGLPNGLFPEAAQACWSVLLLDNALAHLSKAVHEKVRKEIGIGITWGPVKRPEKRPNIERLHRCISDDIFKRLPSTTGSNPYNGRAEKAEEKAITYKLRADETAQYLDVYMAQHNITPTAGLSYRSPLEFIHRFLTDDDHFMLRPLPMSAVKGNYTFASVETVTVRGGIKSGQVPYIQIDHGIYTSSVLRQLGNLIGEEILVQIDEEDFRQVKAFLKNGAELGFLSVTGRWARTKHSRLTRKEINRLITKRIIVVSAFDDPVQVYLDHKSTASKKKSEVDFISPKNAMEAARVSKESGLPLKIVANVEVKKKPAQVAAEKPKEPFRSLINRPMPVIGKTRNRR